MNDGERLNKFLELLPEEKVRNFVSQLSRAEFMRTDLDTVHKYLNWANNVFSAMDNRELDIDKKEFNNLLVKLLRFLSINFFPDSSGFKYYLHPNKRHHAESEQAKFWQKMDKELSKMTGEFERAYNNFLMKAREILDTKKQKHIGTLSYDPQNDVILFGSRTLKLHKKEKQKLFKKLWEERSEKSKTSGKPWSIESLARNLDLSVSETRKYTKALQADLRRIRVPAKIATKDGVQLITD